MEEKEIKNELALQKQRHMLLQEFIQRIQNIIVEKDIKGEDKRKIAIYSRIAEYTFYSEVSIRKFLLGAIPKDMETFVNGILAYGNYLEMDENYLEQFAKEYTVAASAIILNKKAIKHIEHNLILQNLHTIIRRENITNALDSFVRGHDTICYIYGYKLSGKTKSVLAYAYDLIQEGTLFDYLIWNDITTNQDVEEKVIQSTLKIRQHRNSLEQLDLPSQKELFFEIVCNHKMLYIIDLQGNSFTNQIILFIKELSRYAKVILIGIETYDCVSEVLRERICSISFNEGMTKDEVKEMLKLESSLKLLLHTEYSIVDEIYKLTDGFPFATLYLFKRLIEENKFGKSMEDILKEYKTYYDQGYDFLNEKMINQTWETLDPLAKEILSLCSQYSYTLSLQCISYVCKVDITQEKWKNALTSCYQSGLLNHVIGLHPRCKMNHLISNLIKNKNKDNTKLELDLDRMVVYFKEMTAKIGICYNDLDRMKVLDEADEYDVLLEIMDHLFKKKRYREYVEIGVNLKYYIYVRGYWHIGQNAMNIKRYQAAKAIGDINEQLRALCEYINMMAKQRNAIEANTYLKIAKEIVIANQDEIDRSILVLFNHVNALYLFHCTEEYESAWIYWEKNEVEYYADMSQYRKMVNSLWMDKCRYQLEENIAILYEDVKKDYENAVEHHFTRGIIDYQLLLTNILFKQYKKQKYQYTLKEIEVMLSQAKLKLENESVFDIRNEAELYRQLTILYHYQKQEKKKEEYFARACERYKRLHATKSIILLEQEIKGLS